MLALETHDLAVEYRRGFRESKLAVDGLNLQVRSGEVVGFIGRNGAGKSSTIKALMGFLQPARGRALILGRPAHAPSARRQVGFLPEVALYYPWLTAREALWLHGRLAGLDHAETRKQTASLLIRVGLMGHEDERLSRFSKGMLQRVGIAQALLGTPRVLILDEVSSGLDPLGRRDLRDILLQEKANGTTIFFSSHELTEVAQVCDRVILLHKGLILDDRPVSALTQELRRYWIRFSCEGEPPVAALRKGALWEAEFSDFSQWKEALQSLVPPSGEVIDAGEREGALEAYFLRMTS